MSRTFASAVTSVGLALALLVSVEAKPADAPDAYVRAYKLLRAAYPELSGQGLVTIMRTDYWAAYDRLPAPFLSMDILIARQDLTRRDPIKQILTVRIEFRNDQTLSNLVSSGEFVNDPKEADTRQWVEDHQGASEAEIGSLLASRGARFHQPDAMRTEILRQSKAIGTVLGRVQLRTLELVDSPISWKAELFIATGAGRRLYNTLFEPFDGRLTAMRQIPM
jgi:hypothetical protein